MSDGNTQRILDDESQQTNYLFLNLFVVLQNLKFRVRNEADEHFVFVEDGTVNMINFLTAQTAAKTVKKSFTYP